MNMFREASVDALIDRYDAFLLDAYGVLVTTRGAIDGAAAFLERLTAAGKAWLIVSNDASRSIRTTTERYLAFGLPVTDDRVVTSGSLLASYFAREGLASARCVVLGTEESRDYVREAGGEVVAAGDGPAEVCVVCGVTDEAAAPFLETVNRTVTLILGQLAAGRPMRFILPNPDIVYPSDVDAFSFTAGGLAALLEAVIRLRDPAQRIRFEPLGKPYAPIFDAAFARLGGLDRERIVMVGDQLVTDVLGAARAGIDSILVETGVAGRGDIERAEVGPTWVLRNLCT
jgi:HAD superfamily hydrolase (TIGR01450 family)